MPPTDHDDDFERLMLDIQTFTAYPADYEYDGWETIIPAPLLYGVVGERQRAYRAG